MSTPGNIVSARQDSILTGVSSRDSMTVKSTSIAKGTGCTEAIPWIDIILVRPF